MSDTCISVDTGTFHLSYAQNVKTIGLFFNKRMEREWVPKSTDITILEGKKYINNKQIVCEKNIKAQDVLKELEKLDYGKDKCLFNMR